jgi:hypothetical protein
MDINDLLSKSNDLKKEAEIVIGKTKVRDIFGNIGEVVFVGSYALNLLFRRDIDLFVVSDNCSKETALETTKKLLDSQLFQTVGFANGVDYDLPNQLKGYYWELVFYENRNRWKFDVWYTAEKKIKTIEKTQKIMDKLSQKPEARGQILKLKEDLYDGVTYKNSMNGFKIYEKVLGKI